MFKSIPESLQLPQGFQIAEIHQVRNLALAHLNGESKFVQLQKKSTSNCSVFTSPKMSKNRACIFHSLEDINLLNQKGFNSTLKPDFLLLIYLFIYFCLFAFSRAAPAAYGGSQARGLIGAVASGLHHSHSNARSEPCLQPTPQLTATPDTQPTERSQE